jgi:hypothetical protein
MTRVTVYREDSVRLRRFHPADLSLAKTKDALDTIVRMLSPYVGETMARAAALAHCQKLGIVVDGTDIRTEQLDALLRKFAQGLNIFVGREKAAVVVGEIQAAMARAAS